MAGGRFRAPRVPACLFPAARPRWASYSSADPDLVISPTSSCSPQSKAQQKKLPHRLSSVVDAVNERKLPAELRGRANAIRYKERHGISQFNAYYLKREHEKSAGVAVYVRRLVQLGFSYGSETDIINVVEQRIWHSMEEGHFENLPGKGKPLDLNTNPHADPAEDTLYRILSRNGCAPEWIELSKEIRFMITEWRLAMKKAWTSRLNDGDAKWLENSENLKAQMRVINDKILRYNLIVPFGRQMFGLKWEREISKLNE